MNQQSGKKVLFVCLGNICRSPAAEIIFRRFVSDAGLGHAITADSAGTISHHEGSAPDERMADALVRHGFRVEGQARKIKPGDLEDFDLIVTMDEQNHRDVLALDPSGVFHNKVRPFVSFCKTMTTCGCRTHTTAGSADSTMWLPCSGMDAGESSIF